MWSVYLRIQRTAVAQWLRCCATSSLVRSQLVSLEFFIDIKSDRTMDLGSTQPLTEMSNRSISWGKGGRCVRMTTYHHPVSLSRNLGTLTSWNPLGLSRPVMGLLYLYLTFYDLHRIVSSNKYFGDLKMTQSRGRNMSSV